MEQAVNKKIKEGYGIKGVEFPQRRGELILDLIYLSNAKWQEKVFTSLKKFKFKPVLNGEYGIYYTLEGATELILEDLGLDDYIKNNQYTYKAIGYSLKSKRGAEYLFKVATLIDKLSESVNPNYEMIKNKHYLASPYLDELRKLVLKFFIPPPHFLNY
ncbi:MAG: hypothetical protein AB8B46_02550 [Candidatus Midichloriaceae bacterium]